MFTVIIKANFAFVAFFVMSVSPYHRYMAVYKVDASTSVFNTAKWATFCGPIVAQIFTKMHGVQSFGRETIWATDVWATFLAKSHNLTNCVMGNKHKCSINSNKNRPISE